MGVIVQSGDSDVNLLSSITKSHIYGLLYSNYGEF